ncbi:MAG: hypothetical protein JNJ73_21665 [Hyphomonadaceae bacterium]|nr:hypothetical protein [Hyphomonadaceae bacterium]
MVSLPRALTDQDRAAINAAIREAETRTAGEIFCVVAPESSAYREIPLAAGALAALLVPSLLLLAGIGPWFLQGWLFESWTAAHIASAEALAMSTAAFMLAAQAILFVLVALIAGIPAVRRAITPTALKRTRVRQRALEQFLAKDLHRTKAQTGVLIFVSLGEHMAELMADEGVRGRIPPEAWAGPMRALVENVRKEGLRGALAASIAQVGALLAEHVPAGAVNENELPDAVAELPRF